MADATPQRPPLAGTPGSARSGAFGFTCDSDSDGDDALLGSAARAVRLGRTPTLRPGSVSSAQRARSRELAAARSFREASREKSHTQATLRRPRGESAPPRGHRSFRRRRPVRRRRRGDRRTSSRGGVARAELVAAAENDDGFAARWKNARRRRTSPSANAPRSPRASPISNVRWRRRRRACVRRRTTPINFGGDTDARRRRQRRRSSRRRPPSRVSGAKSHVCTPRSNARGCTLARPGPSSRPRTA